MIKLYIGPRCVVAVALAALMVGCGPAKDGDGGKNKSGGKTSGPMSGAVEVIVEAEAMVAQGSFTVIVDGEASVGKGMHVPPKGICTHVTKSADPKPVGSLSCSVSLKTDAKVTIWCRVRWDDSCSNSLVMILPNGMKKTVTGSTLKKWVWIAAAKRIPLKAGTHELSIVAREFGAQIDQILVTDDDKRVPRGVATNFNEMSKE
jgi:hypothetical protein